MANTHSRVTNENNDNNNANPPPPPTLQQVLMMQAQMLQTMQQTMANIQQAQQYQPAPHQQPCDKLGEFQQTKPPTSSNGDPWGWNLDLLMEMKNNSIGEESRRSGPDYNRPGMLRLSDRYTNSRGWRDLMEHNNLATRALVLQAIEELARTSRTSTELRDEYEVY
jgi:hypothetical protein